MIFHSSETADIACSKALGGCGSCYLPRHQPDNRRCPEWSSHDVLQFMVLDFQIAGSVAFISM